MLNSLQDLIINNVPSPSLLIGVSIGVVGSYIIRNIYGRFFSSNLEEEQSRVSNLEEEQSRVSNPEEEQSRNSDLNDWLELDGENSNLDMIENYIPSESLTNFLQLEINDNVDPSSLLPPSDILDQDGRLGSAIVDNALASLHLNIDCIDNFIIDTILGKDFELLDFVVDRLFFNNELIISGASIMFFYWVIVPYVIRTNAGTMFSESLPTPGAPGISENYQGVTDDRINLVCANTSQTFIQSGSESRLEIGRFEGEELFHNTAIGGYIQSYYEGGIECVRENFYAELAHNPNVRLEFSNAIKSLNFYEKLYLYQTLKTTGGSALREDQYERLIRLINELPSLSELSRNVLNLDGRITDFSSVLDSPLKYPFLTGLISPALEDLEGRDEGFQYIVNRAFPASLPFCHYSSPGENMLGEDNTLQKIPILSSTIVSAICICLEQALLESGLPINTDLDLTACVSNIVRSRDLALGIENISS